MHDLRKQLFDIQTSLPLEEVQRRIDCFSDELCHRTRSKDFPWSPLSTKQGKMDARGLYGALSSIIIINRMLQRKLSSLNTNQWYCHIPEPIFEEAVEWMWDNQDGDEEAVFE